MRSTYENARVLVTGAAGFVGSHLVDELVRLGARVRALDDFSDGRVENLALSRGRIEVIEGSVTRPETLDDAVAGSQFIFHLAANASVPRSVADPALDFDTNVVGTFRLVEAVRRAGAGTIVFTSSAGVYGESDGGPLTEDTPPAPRSPYGGSKIAGELILSAYCRCFELDHRAVRIFNTYGPRQRKYVMFDILEKLRKDPGEIHLIGDGTQVRTYSFVSDTVRALLLVGAHPEARSRVFNIAGTRSLHITDILGQIVELIGIPAPEVRFSNVDPRGDILRLEGDTTRLQGLGFVPEVDLREGLRHLIDWHRQEYSPRW